MKLFSQCLTFTPSNAQRIAKYLSAGENLYREGKYALAMIKFREALPWFSSSMSDAETAQYWAVQAYLGMSYYRLKDFWSAHTILAAYMQHNPTDLMVYVTLKACQQEITKQASIHDKLRQG